MSLHLLRRPTGWVILLGLTLATLIFSGRPNADQQRRSDARGRQRSRHLDYQRVCQQHGVVRDAIW